MQRAFLLWSIIIFSLFLGILLSGTLEFFSTTSPIMMKKVILKTQDGVDISGDYFIPRRKTVRGVLLLHMMPATKESFSVFGEKLAQSGFSALAIDLRGHGESVKKYIGGQTVLLDFKKFSDEDHQASVLDVRTAINFLRENGATAIFIVGASIGANLGIRALAEDTSISGGVFLSPGYTYRGIETQSAVGKLHSGQKVFYVGSRDDSPADATAQGLFDETPSGVSKDIKIFDVAGHGTAIFENNPAFMDEVIAWLVT